MATQQNIDAIILAGGQGLRMGGQDKGLTIWQNRPLIEHVIERIAPQVDNLHISANRNLPAYQKFGYPVHTDTKPDFRGPLAGIAACAPYCESDWVVIAPCDYPSLPPQLASALLETAMNGGLEASYAADEHRAHYLCVLVLRTVLAGLNERLGGDDLSVKGWLQTLHCKPTAFSGMTEAFQNINHPERKGQ
mgnify:CR=1 FL=1